MRTSMEMLFNMYTVQFRKLRGGARAAKRGHADAHARKNFKS
jgi:hypothetical protein